MKSNFKKPTKDQELQAWHAFAERVNFIQEISGNQTELQSMMNRLSSYAVAAVTDPNMAFWTYLVADPDRGRK